MAIGKESHPLSFKSEEGIVIHDEGHNLSGDLDVYRIPTAGLGKYVDSGQVVRIIVKGKGDSFSRSEIHPQPSHLGADRHEGGGESWVFFDEGEMQRAPKWTEGAPWPHAMAALRAAFWWPVSDSVKGTLRAIAADGRLELVMVMPRIVNGTTRSVATYAWQIDDAPWMYNGDRWGFPLAQPLPDHPWLNRVLRRPDGAQVLLAMTAGIAYATDLEAVGEDVVEPNVTDVVVAHGRVADEVAVTRDVATSNSAPLSVNKWRVFISYSSADQEMAQAVWQEFTNRGISTFFSPWSIHGGADYSEVIFNAAKNCEVAVFLLSPKAANSKNVKSEFTIAYEFDASLVPFSVYGFKKSMQNKLPGWDYLLANVQVVDYESPKTVADLVERHYL